VRSSDHRAKARAVVLASAAVLAAWLATDYSSIVWSHILTLQYLQFPWRMLMVVALALPLLALPALEKVGSRGAIVALLAIVLLNIGHTEPKRYLVFDDDYYYPQSIAENGINTTTREEYEPHWVTKRPPYSAVKLRATAGVVSVNAAQIGASEQVFTATAQTSTSVEALTFDYPGWTAYIDGRETSITPCPVTGMICFEMPQGQHKITLILEDTPVRRTAKIISIAFAMTLVMFLLLFELRARAMVVRASTVTVTPFPSPGD